MSDDGPIGPFPTWRALYVTVIAWALTVVVALYVFGLAMDVGRGGAP